MSERAAGGERVERGGERVNDAPRVSSSSKILFKSRLVESSWRMTQKTLRGILPSAFHLRSISAELLPPLFYFLFSLLRLSTVALYQCFSRRVQRDSPSMRYVSIGNNR